MDVRAERANAKRAIRVWAHTPANNSAFNARLLLSFFHPCTAACSKFSGAGRPAANASTARFFASSHFTGRCCTRRAYNSHRLIKRCCRSSSATHAHEHAPYIMRRTACLCVCVLLYCLRRVVNATTDEMACGLTRRVKRGVAGPLLYPRP